MDDDAIWFAIPADAPPARYRVGDFVRTPDSKIWRIVGRSTILLRIRPQRWWEKVLMSITRQRVEKAL